MRAVFQAPSDRVDLVVAPVLVLLVADLVEDEELRLGTDEARVGDARFLQVRLGLAGDVPRVAREVLSGHRIDDVGDDADVGFAKNGSRQRRLGSGMASMSDSWMAIQPRIDEPSKPRPSLNVSASQSSIGKRAVLPAAEHVDELQIDHLGLVFLGEREEIVGCRRVGIGRHGSSSRNGAHATTKPGAAATVSWRATVLFGASERRASWNASRERGAGARTAPESAYELPSAALSTPSCRESGPSRRPRRRGASGFGRCRAHQRSGAAR